MKFKLGDCVTWESQSASYSKIKTGVIVEIVPAGKRPTRMKDIGFSRKHESYVVLVGISKQYWPRVKHLKEQL